MDEIFDSIYQHYKDRLDKVDYVAYQNSSEESAEDDEEEDHSKKSDQKAN